MIFKNGKHTQHLVIGGVQVYECHLTIPYFTKKHEHFKLIKIKNGKFFI